MWRAPRLKEWRALLLSLFYLRNSSSVFLFPLFCFYVCCLQQLFDLRCYLLYRFVERLHSEAGQSVICATRGKQLVKPCILLHQRTHFVLCLAAPPQFFYRSFQQNGDCAGGNKSIAILLLYERAAAQRQYKIAAGLVILQQSRERCAFLPSKSRFAERSKNLSYALTLALLDHIIEIQKLPAQSFGQCA